MSGFYQMMPLVLATSNLHKKKEIEAWFCDMPLSIKTLRDYPQINPVEETGTSFAQNAFLKARAVYRLIGGSVLADDSGLVCDVLKGSPGIYSARYAGLGASDKENNQKLLKDLAEICDPPYKARYVCALVYIDAKGQETLVEEACEGLIVSTSCGSQGFGYDPYFYLPDYGCTMAEISLEEKNKISHRGKALSQLLSLIKSSFK